MSLILLRGRPFSPREIAARMPCAWLEPRPGYMWQEDTGTTATTTAGQSVGLILGLDQQQRLASEIIVDGQFANAGAGWALSVGVTANVGSMTFPNATSFTESISQSNAVFSANSVYELQIKGTGTVSYRTGTSDVNTIITLPFSGIFSRASYANRRIQIFNIIGSAATVTCVSCKQILGNHASQATAANRPIYQVDANGRAYLEHNSTQFLTASLPDLGGGVFSSNGSIYWVTPTGMQSQHGQAISTSLSLPAANTNVYSCLVTPERLNAVYENKLGLYFLRLAGLL